MEPTIQSHRHLKVWQKAMDLAEAVYRLEAELPTTETDRLGSQFELQ